jgi:hypothetical protein
MSYTYSLETILKFEKEFNYSYRLNETATQRLAALSKELGAPLQRKTNVSAASATSTTKTTGWENVRSKSTKQKRNTTIPSSSSSAFSSTNVVDEIRIILNKLTDTNYLDSLEKLSTLLEQINESSNDLVADTIFKIATQNIFFSKLYADLFSELISRFVFIKTMFKVYMQTNRHKFLVKRAAVTEENYDAFCKMNEENDNLKSLAQFFINLNINGIISDSTIVSISTDLLTSILDFVKEEDKKDQVDLMSELLQIFYDKKRMKGVMLQYNDETVDFNSCVKRFSKAKTTNFKSLSKKTIFKFMDMVGV